MKVGPLTKRRIDLLPNEILKMIMGQCDGVTVLYALVRSNTRAQTLFERNALSILTDVLRSSTMHSQLCNMLRSILSLRQILRHDGSEDTLQDFVDQFIDCPSLDLRLDLKNLPMGEAMNVLGFAAELCESVTRAERSFVRVRLFKIISKLESKLMQDRYYRTARYESISLDRRPASQAELHRIRRGLWRLHLYYMAFYMPYIALDEDCRGPAAMSLAGKLQVNIPALAWDYSRRYLNRQKGFFWQMTIWELEEMECIWYHLKQNPSLFWNGICPHCHASFLPDDLIIHNRPECQRGSGEACKFTSAISYFRADFEKLPHWVNHPIISDPYKALAAWPDPLAEHAGAGYTYAVRHGMTRVRGPGLSRGPLDKLLNWGYCIWDCDRFESWHMIDSKEGQIPARMR